MSMVMKKITNAVGEGGKEVKGFAKAAGMSSKEFTKMWENDPIKALDAFIKGLGKSGDAGENLNVILDDLGIKGIRETDTLLRLAGAGDVLTDAVETGSKAWKENTALSEEAAERYATTESQMKMLWNQAKILAIDFGRILIPAMKSLMDSIKPVIERFADMDDEAKKKIVAFAGIAAAIGPVLVGLGTLTSSIGSIIGAVKLAIPIITGMGAPFAALLSPVGLVVGGLALLGGAIYKYGRDANKIHEINLEQHESFQQQYKDTGKQIERLDELRGQTKLTGGEWERYLDLHKRLQSETDPKVIKKITDEMDGLQEKSGLSNKEMEDMVGLNESITKTLPGATEKITDQGVEIAGTTDELKKYNEEILKMSTAALEEEFDKAYDNQSKLYDELALKEDNLRRSKERTLMVQEIMGMTSEEEKERMKVILQNQIDQVKEHMQVNALTKEEAEHWREIQENMEHKVALLDSNKDGLKNALKHEREVTRENEKQINEIKKKTKEFDMVTEKLQIQYMEEAGITKEKALQAIEDGKQIELLDKQIEKHEKKKQKIIEEAEAAGGLTEEHEKAIAGIDDQIAGLGLAKRNIADMTLFAGEWNEELKEDVDKQLGIETKTDEAYDILENPFMKKIMMNTEEDETYEEIRHPFKKFIEMRTSTDENYDGIDEKSTKPVGMKTETDQNYDGIFKLSTKPVGMNTTEDGTYKGIFRQSTKPVGMNTSEDGTYKGIRFTTTKPVITRTSTDDPYKNLGNPITKFIDIVTRGKGSKFWAEGTPYHPGGPAFLGEEGEELVKIGNRFSLVGFGHYDLPRGAQVFTHEETKKMLSGAVSKLTPNLENVNIPHQAYQTDNRQTHTTNYQPNITINTHSPLEAIQEVERWQRREAFKGGIDK